MQELEIRCRKRSSAGNYAREFLKHYTLHIDGLPYAIHPENLFAGTDERYDGVTGIWPLKGATIVATIPIEGAERAAYEGYSSGNDVPRQTALILGRRKFIVYLDPKMQESSQEHRHRDARGLGARAYSKRNSRSLVSLQDAPEGP